MGLRYQPRGAVIDSVEPNLESADKVFEPVVNRSQIRIQMGCFKTPQGTPSALELSQCHVHQGVTTRLRQWTVPCCLRGVRFESGYTLIELMIALGIAGIMTAVAVPVVMESTARNAVWTGSELIGSQLRQARLKAISRNRLFRVRFDCPNVGNVRVLVVTGDPLIDNAVDRCSDSQSIGGVMMDSGIIAMPQGASFGTVTTLEVNGRGIYSADAIPKTITVTNGTTSRDLTITLTGQITFETY